MSGAHKYYFVDDSAGDPSFAAFRTTLMRIAAAHDKRALRASLAPTVDAGFNGRSPIPRVMELFAGPSDLGVSLWPELQRALELGAIKKEGGFCAPSIGCDGKLGPEDMAITGDDVAVLKEPDPTSKVLERLSHDVIHPAQASSGELIETTSGGKQYRLPADSDAGRPDRIRRVPLRPQPDGLPLRIQEIPGGVEDRCLPLRPLIRLTRASSRAAAAPQSARRHGRHCDRRPAAARAGTSGPCRAEWER